MIYRMYAIRDAKLDAYTPPYFSPTHGSAIRAFQDHVLDTNSPAHKHPEDYTLHYLGTFDDQEGTLAPEKIVRLASALEFTLTPNKE